MSTELGPKKIQALLNAINGYVEPAQEALKKIEPQIPFTENDEVNEEDWQAMPEKDRAAVVEQVRAILFKLRRADLRIGQKWLAFCCITLFVLVVIYLVLHAANPSVSQTLTGDTVSITAGLETIENETDNLPTDCDDFDLNADDEDAQPNPSLSDEKKSEFKTKRKQLIEQFKALNQEFKDLRNDALVMGASLDSQKLLGELQSYLERKKKPRDELLTELKTALSADLQHSTYFWNDHAWRWLEFVFWAEFGVLVGILFYIGTELGKNAFEPSDIFMFIVEIVIAPFVVLVIFFLIQFSGFKEVTPNSSSITANIGVAFILGFAIRRTIGRLNMIKRTLLPNEPKREPATESS